MQPPLLEKELVNMFMDTLHSPYIKMMIGSVSSGFSNPMEIGKRIKSNLKSWKILGASSSHTGQNKFSSDS